MKTKLENPKIKRQRAVYTALLQNLGQAGFEQIQKTLDERETVEAERGLSPDVVERLKKKIRTTKPASPRDGLSLSSHFNQFHREQSYI